jgi:hypothetical protein
MKNEKRPISTIIHMNSKKNVQKKDEKLGASLEFNSIVIP